MYDGSMETVKYKCEYLVHARLDCWISRNTLPWHIVAQLVSAKDATLLWLAWMNYCVKIRTHCKA